MKKRFDKIKSDSKKKQKKKLKKTTKQKMFPGVQTFSLHGLEDKEGGGKKKRQGWRKT